MIKLEIGNNSSSPQISKILSCLKFIEENLGMVMSEYKKNIGKMIEEMIIETDSYIKSLRTNILNEFYLKIKEGEKLNMVIKI